MAEAEFGLIRQSHRRCVVDLENRTSGCLVEDGRLCANGAAVLEVSIDELVHGKQDEKARAHLSDHELLRLFNKTQKLEDEQKKTVVDLLSAFLLKADITRQLV